MSKLVVHVDGGARGNPGPAAVGIVIAGTSVVQSILAEGWLADDPNATLAAL